MSRYLTDSINTQASFFKTGTPEKPFSTRVISGTVISVEDVVYVAGLATAEGLNESGPFKMVVNSPDYSVVAEKSLLAADLAPW